MTGKLQEILGYAKIDPSDHAKLTVYFPGRAPVGAVSDCVCVLMSAMSARLTGGDGAALLGRLCGRRV